MRVDQSVRQALLSLPRLALCDHPETVSVIQELVVESSLATGLELRTLHSGLESSEESLATACLVSPQAQHVFIVLHPGQSALCLLALHHLQSLKAWVYILPKNPYLSPVVFPLLASSKILIFPQ